MLTKGQLKDILAVCDGAGMSDNVEIKIQRPDLIRLELDASHFIVEKEDASYNMNASGHYDPSLSEASAIVLKQL